MHHLRHIFLIISFQFIAVCSWGQSFPAAPIINGSIGTNEYPLSYVSGGQTWYISWDNTFLYIGLTGAPIGEPAALFIDIHDTIPINGNSNPGASTGNNFDNVTSTLPFNADIAIHVKNDYREIRRWTSNQWLLLRDSNNGQGLSGVITDFTSNFYADNGSNNNTREARILWDDITNGNGRPSKFNWLGYCIGNNSSTFGSIPDGNPNSTNPACVRYFHMEYTDSVPTTPLNDRNCYTHIGGSINGFGAINAYNFTMNTPTATITKNWDANWNIGNDLYIGTNSTIQVGTAGTNDTAKINVGRDVIIQSGTFRANSVGPQTLRSGQFKIGRDLRVTNGLFDMLEASPNNGSGTPVNQPFGYLVVDRDVLIENSTATPLSLKLSNNFGGDLFVGRNLFFLLQGNVNFNGREVVFFGPEDGGLTCAEPVEIPYVRVIKNDATNIITFVEDLEVTERVIFERGNINTGANKLIFKKNRPDSVNLDFGVYAQNGGVIGQMNRSIEATTTGKYIFPVMKGLDKRYFTIEKTTTGGNNALVQVEYVVPAPAGRPNNAGFPLKDATITTNTIANPPTVFANDTLTTFRNRDFWKVDSLAGSNFTYNIISRIVDFPISTLSTDQPITLIKRESVDTLTSWQAVGSYVPVTTFTIGDFEIRRNNLTGFSIFTLASRNPNILATEDCNFSAQHVNLHNLLKWQITDPENVQGYELEHSLDGNNFQLLASLNEITSNYKHLNPENGKHYYRLKINKGLQNTYSKIALVKVGKSTNGFSIFPNPSKGSFSIQTANTEPFEVKIQDLTGKTLMLIQANANKPINTQHLSKGVYLVHVKGFGVEKLVVW